MRGAEIDEARALEMLRAGAGLRATARALRCGTRRVRPLAEAHGIAIRPPRGRAPRPFDEARALELLRGGMSAHRVREEVGAGGMRAVVRLARAHGIALRRRRTAAECAGQMPEVLRLRSRGWGWARIAARLGYGPNASASLRRRAEAAWGAAALVPVRAVVRALNAIRPRLCVAGWEDADSLRRIASDPARHWLLRPEELAVARRFGMLGGERRTAARPSSGLAAPERKV